MQELQIFKQRLEKYIGHEITNEDIPDAIDIYNENRQLLRELYDLRGLEDYPLISGRETGGVLYWVNASPKDKANETLKACLYFEIKGTR